MCQKVHIIPSNHALSNLHWMPRWFVMEEKSKKTVHFIANILEFLYFLTYRTIVEIYSAQLDVTRIDLKQINNILI